MKKIFIGILLVCSVVLVGCSNTKEEKVMKCTLTNKDVVNKYEVQSTYNVYYTGDVVNKVVSNEVVTSEEDKMITYFKETLEKSYSAMKKNYGGYEYTIKEEANKVISDVTIDYTKVNMEQMVKDDASIKNVVNGKNQLTVEGIKSLYSSMNITCEK